MNRTASRVILITLIVTGVLFLCIGILQGQDDMILNKAIRICLECIGIG